MLNKYEAHFAKALAKYQEQAKRPGYMPGLFTSWRHSFAKYPAISILEQKIKGQDDSLVKVEISNFLKPLKDKGKINNHSFAAYLLDLLIAEFPEEEWKSFLPKPIVFYQGQLYRGTAEPHDKVFKDGMEGSSSPNVEDYCNSVNFGVGVSTSKSKEIASEYQQSNYVSERRYYIAPKGFLYKIHYRGSFGIDIDATAAQRREPILISKKEVNIIGRIEPADIYGCWDKNDKWIDNPYFNAEREKEAILELPMALDAIYGPSQPSFQ